MIDYNKIARMQISLIEDLENSGLSPNDKVKLGKVLVANYKKAKQILKSRVKVEGDWERVLEVCKSGLGKLVDDMEGDLFHTDEMSANNVIGYVDFLSQVQFLNFTEATQYKFVDTSLESEINMDIYKDLDI